MFTVRQNPRKQSDFLAEEEGAGAPGGAGPARSMRALFRSSLADI